jgi:hypothetical protein
VEVVEFMGRHRRLWFGGTLIVLGLLLLAETMGLVPAFAHGWCGSIILGCLGLAFGAIYLADRRHWWAIIPGGCLLSVALVAAARGERLAGWGTVGLFFFGLAATFGLIALVERRRGGQWAIYPALGCLGLATVTGDWSRWWPVLLIVIGLRALWRGRSGGRR